MPDTFTVNMRYSDIQIKNHDKTRYTKCHVVCKSIGFALIIRIRDIVLKNAKFQLRMSFENKKNV